MQVNIEARLEALGVNPAMDYAAMRQEGIGQLELLAGSEWTDFNEHDPGITILEQFCYALTELSYRIGFDVKDLLADGEAEPYRSLPSPAEILTTQPVTLSDFRKRLVDIEGVSNAWIEPVDAPDPALFFDPTDGNLYLEAAPHRETVVVGGIYKVSIASDGTLPDADLAQAVDRCLQSSRSLGQEFLPAQILNEQKVVVSAAVEIGATEDPERVQAEILRALSSFISPRIKFSTLQEMLAQGMNADEIFDGPALQCGFIDTAELESFDRKKGLRVSDLIRGVMDVPGVSAIDSINVRIGGDEVEYWYLPLDQDSAPVLDDEKSAITLLRNGMAVATDAARARKLFEDLRRGDRPQPLPEGDRDIKSPSGRDRRAWRYHSIQHHFPAVYGIGELGLPSSAGPTRRAQAMQLKAYLLFFDQLLANGHAQLANAKSLFSFDFAESPRTYFSQLIDDSSLGLDGLWTNPGQRESTLLEITETSESASERKNRFLNHLLSRFAEDFTDFYQVGTGPIAVKAQIKAKCEFLQDYRLLGAGRGVGFDSGHPDAAANGSGVAGRIGRKMGLSISLRQKLADLQESDAGGFHLLEHVLLRPRQADLASLPQGDDAGGWQSGVMIALPAGDRIPPARDPFSRQISLVFPDWIAAFKQEGFADFIARLLRDETPAHVHARLVWLNRDQMRVFETAYGDWLDQLSLLNQGSGNTRPRDARDRLIECLGIGTSYPLRDIQLAYDSVVVLDQEASVSLIDAQSGVRYTLCDENGDPVTGKNGQKFAIIRPAGLSPATTPLVMPPITKDISFTILASREFDVNGSALDSPLEVYLSQAVSVKAGINTALKLEFMPAPRQVAKDTTITVDYGDAVTVGILASQPGISYELVIVAGGVEKVISVREKGDKGEIYLTSSENFRENTQILVKASRTLLKSEFKYLDARLTILARPNTNLAAIPSPAVIDYATPTTLTLPEAQASADYRLFCRDLVISDYPEDPTGDPKILEGRMDRTKTDDLLPAGQFKTLNGVCSIDTETLKEDRVYFVQATNRENGEQVWLNSPAVVLVRPNTAPKVGSVSSTVVSGAEAVVTVDGAQKGALYQLRAQAVHADVNTPGSHWQERGVGGGRVEIDWVVEQPEQPEAYQTLMLPTGKLEAETVFEVLAIKRLTGLSALLEETVKISLSSQG